MKVGAIAYRNTASGVEICLVSSRRHRDRLTFPKGIVKSGEPFVKAVKRELFEEAGLRGSVKRKSRPICFHGRPGETDSVLYFLVEVKKVSREWPEMDQRERLFIGVEQLEGLSLSDGAKGIIKQVKKITRLRNNR